MRLIDALVRRLEHEDTLLAMNGGELGTTLCQAAAAGGLLDVRFLLARGADLEAAASFTANNGMKYAVTALRWSALHGHLAVASFLLDRGAQLHDGALLNAADGGYTAVVALLLDRGANVHHVDDFALRLATWRRLRFCWTVAPTSTRMMMKH